MYDVITVGSATVDAFVETGSKLFMKTREKGLYSIPFGSKILVEQVKFATGGGGTNAAVSLARLGFRTAWLGKIGEGGNSKRVMDELKKEDIDTSLVSRDKARTGYSVILDAKGKDRTILAYKGSNDDLGWKEVDAKRLKTRWFYFASMTGKSWSTMKKLAAFAEKNSKRIMFNPSSYMCKRGAKHLKPVLDRAEILSLNREEAGYLVKGKSIKQLLKGLYRLVPHIVIITQGSKGVHCFDGKNIYSAKPNKVKVLESTGAGDAFGSGFLAGFVRTGEISKALQTGIANAESVITHYGAKNRLLTWRQAQARIRKSPAKVKVDLLPVR
ncbi:carbohydrate kinase family protein [Candidatus Woesearchaeota archaeon]|nr:carbohydrate kinase family protein [Candidatus Woesearchaeota archaeon]